MATRRATKGPAGVLDSTSKSPKERNTVDTPGSRLRNRSFMNNAG